MTSRRALWSALAAFLVGIAFLLEPVAFAQVQVPNPVPRPQKAPNPKAALPAPAPGSSTSSAKASSPKSAEPVVAGGYKNGRVVVLRGLANVFSRGMDTLAKDLKALGIDVTLMNHSRWQTLSAKLIQEYRADPKTVAPIILIGHSLGGDASIVMANWLAHNGVPVRFVVIFDAVAQTHPIVGGVQEVLNFYKPKGYGQEVKAAPSFKGVIRNVDLTERKDIDHLNIDEDDTLHEEVTADVLRILNETNKPARKAAPAPKPPPVAATTTPAAPGTASATAEPPPATAPASAEPEKPVAIPAEATGPTPKPIPAEATAPAD